MKPDIGDWILYSATPKRVVRIGQVKRVTGYLFLEDGRMTKSRSVIACVLSRGEAVMLFEALEALETERKQAPLILKAEYEKTINELPGIFARRRADLVAKFNGETK